MPFLLTTLAIVEIIIGLEIYLGGFVPLLARIDVYFIFVTGGFVELIKYYPQS